MPKSSKQKLKYQKEYNARPEEKKKRAANNAARREYERKHGELPPSVDVAHKRALENGGGNGSDNLEAQSRTKNRGWRGGQSGYRVPNKK